MKRGRLFLSFLLILFFALFYSFVSVSSYSKSYDTTTYVTVRCGGYNNTFYPQNYSNSIGRTINEALRFAGHKATKNSKATVKISKGNYLLDKTLKIYSNTILYATGCTFVMYQNMLVNGYNNNQISAYGYNGAENITVIGGTWNINVPFVYAGNTSPEYTHSTFRFAHCNNILIKNCIFKNNYNSHDIEFGGVNNAVVSNCKFINDNSINSLRLTGGKEAVQIDITTEVAVPYLPSYDNTPSQNIIIKDNYFKNKYRGVGSHHGIIGKPFNNISILNNTFQNIAGEGIFCIYMNNVTICNNVMNNVGAGIDLYSVSKITTKNLLNPLNLSSEETLNSINKSKINITDNSIIIRTKNNKFKKPFAIRLSGSNYTDSDPETNIKKGIYYIYNASVFNNKIITSYKNEIIFKNAYNCNSFYNVYAKS